LRFEKRFNDSSTYDSYYCCNICGDFVKWVFDNKSIVKHLASESNVGSVKSIPSSVEDIRYKSMIISLRQYNSGACMDVVMIATQSNSTWRPQVICNSSIDQHVVEYDEEKSDPFNFKPETRDTLIGKIALGPTKIVAHRDDIFTGAIMCHSSQGIIFWRLNGNFLVGFNVVNIPGDSDFRLQPEDSSVALWQAIVLDRNSQGITSLVFGNGNSNSGNINVSCHNRVDDIVFKLSSPSAIIDTTQQELSVDTSYSVSEIPISGCVSQIQCKFC